MGQGLAGGLAARRGSAPCRPSPCRRTRSLGAELAQVDKNLAQTAVQEPRVKRLMTITGVNVTVALSIVALFGESNGSHQRKSVSAILGSTRGSGSPATSRLVLAASPNRPSPRGSMLVEAAWVISGVPGPLRAFFMRIRDKRGKHVAAVATARKRAVIVWHMLTKDEDYIWSRSALLDWKL